MHSTSLKNRRKMRRRHPECELQAVALSKNVSPFDINVQTTQAEVTLDGQVPSEQIKAVAGAIALDTSGVKEVHNNLEHQSFDGA